jgi:hypothetical protein
MALVGVWVLAGSWLLVGLSVGGLSVGALCGGLSAMGKVVVMREILSRQWHQQTADPYLWQSIRCE